MKRWLKRILGDKARNSIKGWVRYAKALPRHLGKTGKMSLFTDDVQEVNAVAAKGKHVFCGYYDICPNQAGKPDVILVHVIDKHCTAGKDSAVIALADISTGRLQPVGKTMAWCWQMGARLRWSREPDTIYYNDCIDGKYCCVKYNVLTQSVMYRYARAFYDISADEALGAAIPFSRLQRLRPGYGYSNLPDATAGMLTPENAGLDIISLTSGEVKCSVSLSALDSLLPAPSKGESYINHVSFSPNGSRVMFFYLWKTNAKPGWKATLWVLDTLTGQPQCLESKDQVSHYAWKDNDTLLITGVSADTKKPFYREYSVPFGGFEELTQPHLNRDGHPVFSRKQNRFYTDSYPDGRDMQECFCIEGKAYQPLIRLFHDPRLFGEKRCDLHPKYLSGRESIALDTTYRRGVRSVLVLDIREGKQ